MNKTTQEKTTHQGAPQTRHDGDSRDEGDNEEYEENQTAQLPRRPGLRICTIGHQHKDMLHEGISILKRGLITGLGRLNRAQTIMGM